MLFSHVPPQWPAKLPVKIAFIAEAPGDDEIRSGQPLTGPSGRVFNAMMRTAGLDRSEYFITNVFDEKLPDNDVANWCVPLREAKEQNLTDLAPIGPAGFLKREHRWHLERLREELKTARPTVIVPLGGTALWAMSRQTGITAHRGSVSLATHVIEGAKMLPTFHPTAVIHQWKQYSVVVGDLIRARIEADKGPSIIYPKRELLLEPSLVEIEDYLPRLLSSDLLSVDIETGWNQITCIGFAPSTEEAICIPYWDRRKLNKSYWGNPADEFKVRRIVQEVLASDTPKLGQNFGGYDLYWLLEKYHMRVNNLVEDTRLQHHAIYPELPKSLAFMGASYSNQGAWKHWGHKNDKRDDS